MFTGKMYANIEPLNRNNFDTWKIQAEAVLTKAGLYECLTKTCDAQKDSLAKAELFLMIAPSELRLVKSCKSAKEIWETVQKAYQSRGPARKATLLKKLIKKKLKVDDDVRDHINEFMDLVDKLKDMEIEIHEDLLTIMMLYSLPEQYENFRIAIESRDKLPTSEELKIKIIEESEARNNNKEEVEKEEEAHYSNKNKKQNQKRLNLEHKKNIKCNNCKKKGHLEKDCWSKKREQGQSLRLANDTCLSVRKTNNEENWCLDSGCTSHMCNEKAMFNTMIPINESLNLASTDKTEKIEGKGTVLIKFKGDNVHLMDTLYVPNLSTNLISIAKATANGCKAIFNEKSATISNKKGKSILIAYKEDGLYYVKTDNKEMSKLTEMNQIDVWHKKLAHVNEKDLKNAIKNKTIRGIEINTNEKLSECETCIKGKMVTLPFSNERDNDVKAKKRLHIVHSDVCGPMPVTSNGGHRYFITFTDEYSRYCRVYFLKQKSEALQKFKYFKIEMENFTKESIIMFQSDNGTEYINKEFNDYLKKNGITRRLSAPYTPQQNGLSERKNRTLQEKARCMLIESNLKDGFWAEAINTANYITNRLPTRANDFKTPFELWVGYAPSVRHVHQFGQKAFVLNKRKKNKLSPKAQEGIFLGYSDTTKGFRIWLEERQNIVISRDVKVLNKMFYEKENIKTNPTCTESERPKYVELYETIPTIREPETISQAESSESDEYEDFDDNNADNAIDILPEIRETPMANERPQRQRRLPAWAEDYEIENNMLVTALTCLNENEHDEEWHDAIKAEIRAHIKNGTWKIIKKENIMRVVGHKIVLRNKVGPNNKITKKARLVACGYSQRPGIDYDETYSPVAKLSSIRSLIALAAEEDLKLCQMDVTTAYLNGELNENIYMKAPHYLEQYISEIMVDESEKDLDMYNKAKEMLKDAVKNKDRVCKLQKSLYGLKQSGRQWNKRLDTELKKLGMMQSKADPCIYVSGGDEMIKIAVYVDDLLIAYKSKEKLDELKTQLKMKFEMKDLGRPEKLLGMDFIYKNNTIKICQKGLIEDALKKFHVEDCKATSTPIEPRLFLEKNMGQLPDLPYKNLIGTLMYLAVGTRPDIMFSVSYLSQFNDFYNETHFKAAKRVLRYLKGTKDVGLEYKKQKMPLIGMADADWGGDKLDRKSFSGYCFKFAGSMVSWMAKKQPNVALSTAEAEYVALTEAAKEAIHLKSIFEDIGVKSEDITIFDDNQAAIKLACNPIVSSKSKHIDLRIHFIRDCVVQKVIQLKYLETGKMEADMLTKGLSGPRLQELKCSAGIE